MQGGVWHSPMKGGVSMIITTDHVIALCALGTLIVAIISANEKK